MSSRSIRRIAVASVASGVALGAAALPASAQSSPHGAAVYRSGVVISGVQYDSPGFDDRSNYSLNREWIDVTNTSRRSVNLDGWRLSDGDGHTYIFDHFRLGGRSTVRVHTGIGRDTYRDVYQDRRTYVWDNRSDTATLRNDDGRFIDEVSWGGRHYRDRDGWLWGIFGGHHRNRDGWRWGDLGGRHHRDAGRHGGVGGVHPGQNTPGGHQGQGGPRGHQGQNGQNGQGQGGHQGQNGQNGQGQGGHQGQSGQGGGQGQNGQNGQGQAGQGGHQGQSGQGGSQGQNGQGQNGQNGHQGQSGQGGSQGQNGQGQGGQNGQGQNGQGGHQGQSGLGGGQGQSGQGGRH
ncbi:lamin tail domain-containing protein [Streptomyces sp. bgisy031]|uniref:lamin tail domain-containing protein n=1 Tax=Streptomyces sp. bgisy031 TaxID=3413772 RepID=UPI003D755E0A